MTQTSGEGFVFPTQTILALLFKEFCTGLAHQTKVNIVSP